MKFQVEFIIEVKTSVKGVRFMCTKKGETCIEVIS